MKHAHLPSTLSVVCTHRVAPAGSDCTGPSLFLLGPMACRCLLTSSVGPAFQKLPGTTADLLLSLSTAGAHEMPISYNGMPLIARRLRVQALVLCLRQVSLTPGHRSKEHGAYGCGLFQHLQTQICRTKRIWSQSICASALGRKFAHSPAVLHAAISACSGHCQPTLRVRSEQSSAEVAQGVTEIHRQRRAKHSNSDAGPQVPSRLCNSNNTSVRLSSAQSLPDATAKATCHSSARPDL